VRWKAIPIFNPAVDDHPARGNSRAMTDRLDAVFAALADPTRRAILAMLLEDDMAVTDVAEPFAMSLAAISKHLAVLSDANLISREKRGRVIWCKLEPEAMREATVWMRAFGQVDPLDLDAFERFLEQELSEED
jgi:DNA-binding transcriptional ArsR family regulator